MLDANYNMKETPMHDNNRGLSEAIHATSLKLNLSQFAVEKDYHVTQAIAALTAVENEFFALVFQGGTCLSKAYKLIARMSEDVDFRVVQKKSAQVLGKEARRKKLRHFRHDLIHALKDAGFNIADEAVDVLYEGRFMSIKASFAHADKLTYLKPYVAIDCFLGDMILSPIAKPITTLIKQALGEKCDHQTFLVDCSSWMKPQRKNG